MSQHECYLLENPASPVKRLLIYAKGDELIRVTMLFDNEPLPTLSSQAPSPAIQKLIEQLKQYGDKAHSDWSLAIDNQGTAFQQKVWRYLQKIPLGTTQSYGQIATSINSSARAVGNACRANPWLLIVPCHRVVKSNHIGGFAGQLTGEAIEMKQRLLHHEQQ